MKIDYYLNFWNGNSTEPLIIFFGILYIIVLIYFMFIVRKKIKKFSAEEKIYKISTAFVLLAISSFWNIVIFQRCTWLLIFFILYWYLYLKSEKKNKSSNIIFVYDIVMCILTCLSLILYFFTYQYGILTF